MKAVILAAGTGSRLRPITLEKPKCLVSVGGRSILERQVEAYKSAGVDEIVVLTGYKHESIKTACEKLAESYGVSIHTVINDVYANTDNLFTLSRGKELLAGRPFLLSNGDVVFPPSVPRQLTESDTENAVCCDTSTYSEEGMKIITTDDRQISGISKEFSSERSHAVSIDLYQFSSIASEQLFNRIDRLLEQDEGYDAWTEKELDRIFERGKPPFYPVDIAGEPWVEIDDHYDLALADRKFISIGPLKNKRAFFFDLDGTIYVDNKLTPGAADIVELLRRQNIDVYFLSNNSSKTHDTYASKLANLGIETTPEHILLSTDGLVDYLETNDITDTYVIGTAGLRTILSDRGINPEAEDPTHVVVGFDTELTYEKLEKGCLAIQQGANYLLTHPDYVCPTEAGYIPDAGAISAAVDATVGRSPDHVFGKPRTEMIQHVLDEHELSPEEITIVGDRLHTEIELANRLGCDSVCVLTGDADRRDIETADATPSIVVENVGDIVSIYDS